MKNYLNLYTSGEYFTQSPTFDKEDSPWKAKQLFDLYKKYDISEIQIISEVGCGSGEVLYNFSKHLQNDNNKYFGFDISPQAIDIANNFKKERNSDNFTYELSSIPTIESDLLLCVDVFEHIEDEFNFLRTIKTKSKYFLFNIPLDLSLQSLLREQIILSQRKRVGHINYYTKSLALETLKDTGFEIIGIEYGKWYKHYKAKSISTKIVNIIRNILMPIFPDFCVKILGGSSLLVLAK